MVYKGICKRNEVERCWDIHIFYKDGSEVNRTTRKTKKDVELFKKHHPHVQFV